MITLTCPCGSRLNVRGMPPGRSGRCPSCGGPVRVPGPEPTPAAESEWDWEGSYDLQAEPEPEPATPAAPAPPGRDYGWGSPYDLGASPPPPPPPPATLAADPDGALPPPVAPKAPPKRREPPPPEPWFPPRLGYPARGMEGLIMVASLGVATWVMGTLVPEYGLALMADSVKIGTPLMGYLVTWVTSIPLLLFVPVALAYWLQYLGRVLLAAATGERNPPRPPDRDVDGLLAGLGSWVAWGVLGLGVGAAPAAIGYATGTRDPSILVGLGLLGLPYALMALLLSFLHDEDLAARPWRVLGALARVGPSVVGLAVAVAGLLGAVAGAFALLLQLRERAFYPYLLASLPCWGLAAWAQVVAMQTLGSYFYAHRRHLRWRRPQAWWEQP